MPVGPCPSRWRSCAYRMCRHLARKAWLEDESAFLSERAGCGDGLHALRMSSITYRIAIWAGRAQCGGAGAATPRPPYPLPRRLCAEREVARAASAIRGGANVLLRKRRRLRPTHRPARRAGAIEPIGDANCRAALFRRT